MFRYIGFSWNSASPSQVGLANQLKLALLRLNRWQPALRLSGLQVYTAGTARGINGVYPLPFNQGVVLGRLFRRRDPAATSTPTDIEFTQCESDRIVHSDGRALLETFWGRYVAFLPDGNDQGRVLRDPTGALPCYSLEIGGVTCVFSWLEDVLEALPGLPPLALNWDAVAAHLLLGRLEGRETALEGVRRILPGELTPLTAGQGQPASLWSAVEMARRPMDTEPTVAAAELRETVVTCARQWASCYPSLLLRLSGGFDSSVLLGSLRTGVSAQRIVCLNYHSPGSDSDERRYARLAAQRAGTTLVERTRDVALRLDEVLKVARTPAPGSYVGRMGSNRMDADTAAAHGAHAMFTGAGGDQLFFEIRCTWPAADYLKLRGLDRGFPGAVLDAARLGRVSFWQALRQAVADRSVSADVVGDIAQFVTLAGPSVRERVARSIARFSQPGLGSSRLPIGKLHQVQELSYPLEYYDPYLREAALEVVNPLLSQPVVELCLRTPTYLLTRGGRGRALARQAFANDIPREIANRQSKGGMEEHVAAVLQRNLPLARSLLLDGRLASQGLIDRKRVEAALSGRPSASDVYVSEIHNCIAIEAWVQRFDGRPSAAA